MRRYVTEPIDAGRFEPRVRIETRGASCFGRETAGHRAGNQRGAFFFQALDQCSFPFCQNVDFRRLLIKEIGYRTLLVDGGRLRDPDVLAEFDGHAFLTAGAIHFTLAHAPERLRYRE